MGTEPVRALNDENAFFRGMLRELCAVNESSGAIIPRAIGQWWETEKILLEAERQEELRVKTEKRAKLEEQIAQLEAQLAAL